MLQFYLYQTLYILSAVFFRIEGHFVQCCHWVLWI